MEKMHIQTSAGFEWDMDPAVMDDILVIEDLAALDQGDLLKVPEVLRRLLGEPGKRALYEHLKTEEGRVPISAVSAALAEIITAMGDSGKKIMALAKMISVDRDALICDMAETYHIYDLRGLPGRMLAVLAFGLRADSRIMQRLNKQEFATETMLLATIADRLGLLVWHQTRDGQRGVNRPQSIIEAMTGGQTETIGFASPEEFEEARRRIIYGD